MKICVKPLLMLLFMVLLTWFCAGLYAQEGETVRPNENTKTVFKTLVISTDDGKGGVFRTIVITGIKKNLTKVVIPESINGVPVKEIAERAFERNKKMRELVIADNITKIGDRAFSLCYSLQKVTLGKSLSSIPQRAFYECTKLKEIELPVEIRLIAKNAFSDCKSLRRVSFGRNVREIGESAFSGCTSLESINITPRINVIGNNAFASCAKLSKIFVEEGNTRYASLDGVLFDKTSMTLVRYPEGKKQSKYEIPEHIKTIGVGAFSFCARLTEIKMPPSVGLIEEYAFFYCKNLVSINITEQIKIEGDRVFTGCENLVLSFYDKT